MGGVDGVSAVLGGCVWSEWDGVLSRKPAASNTKAIAKNKQKCSRDAKAHTTHKRCHHYILQPKTKQSEGQLCCLALAQTTSFRPALRLQHKLLSYAYPRPPKQIIPDNPSPNDDLNGIAIWPAASSSRIAIPYIVRSPAEGAVDNRFPQPQLMHAIRVEKEMA